MERIRSLADLQQIKERQLKESGATDADRIIIGMGTCGIAAGAREVLLAITEAVEAHSLQIVITQTGCIGMCEQEPLVDIHFGGDERITYGKVTPALAKKIVDEHVIGGQILTESAVGRLTKED